MGSLRGYVAEEREAEAAVGVGAGAGAGEAVGAGKQATERKGMGWNQIATGLVKAHNQMGQRTATSLGMSSLEHVVGWPDV